MILSDKKIVEEIKAGNIILDPFEEKYLNPNSVDLTLAPQFKIYDRKTIRVRSFSELPQWIKRTRQSIRYESGFYEYELPLDPREANDTVEFVIPKEGYVLQPGEVYLYACNERIGVKNNIRAKVEGKSSLGRLGLFVHVTAGFIDTGFTGSLVLELVATRPIIVYPNMKICQIEFARVEGEILESYDQKSGSKYHNQTGVQESKYHENF
jgi:dCTP deaminase